MILKIIFASVGIYNILWTGDYIRGFIALIIYQLIDITQRLDKLDNKGDKYYCGNCCYCNTDKIECNLFKVKLWEHCLGIEKCKECLKSEIT